VLPYEAGKQMSSNVHNFQELRPRIIVMGVGGAGGNAVNNMIASGLHGVEFVAANTDAQALSTSGADIRLQLGVNLTEGLGAGSNPEIGEGAAEEVMEEMKELLSEAHMVFIACGMGGGTGTGAAPVIARIAQELGVLTVAVVTKPFQFEGQRRMRIAESGIEQLRQYVDTMIVIPNQNLFRLANEQTTFADSFCLADSVLNSGVACVTDLIMKEGLINLDFADVKTVITEMGAAVMGTGVAHGEGRARKAAEEAISNPLIDDISLAGAKGLLISISGGQDMTLFEVDEVASRIRQEVDQNANIIVGATFDEQLEGYLRVSLVASGLNRGHPESMHQEADRRRMEIDAEIEQNTLGLNERLQTLDASQEHLGALSSDQGPEMGAGQGNPGVHNSTGRLRPQPPVVGAGQKDDRPIPHRQNDGGRGNVQIVNKPPRFMSPDSDAGYTPPATPGANNPMTGREFVAGAPQSVNRSMRRMPSMEDLPITGQNQLRAYKAPEGKFKEAEPKKKGGFFSRLTGRTRKQETEAHEVFQDSPNQEAFIQEPLRQEHSHDQRQTGGTFVAPQRADSGHLDPHAGNVSSNNVGYDHSNPPLPHDVQGEQSRDPRYQDTRYNEPSSREQVGQDQRSQGRGNLREGKPQGVKTVSTAPETPLPGAVNERSVSQDQVEGGNKGEYDLSMEEHYKMHPSSEPIQVQGDQAQGGPVLKNQPHAQEDWAPSRPETPAERYPTLELNKTGTGSLPLDEEESIADIPPFLKEKRKG
jgi:cell division protein FtsZ